MNAKDMIALVEYMKTFDKPQKNSRWKKPKEEKFDLVALLRQKKEEADLLEKFLKEQEKLNKKEEKKEGKGHSFTFAEGIILAYAAQFVIGPLYKVALVNLGVH